ncbi:MAG: hypothetical protein LBP19_03315 [Treponema sp.]|nr:hypothetical protein [Treponema sp.]
MTKRETFMSASGIGKFGYLDFYDKKDKNTRKIYRGDCNIQRYSSRRQCVCTAEGGDAGVVMG